ncbi:hypothetical protein [Shewanella waksmanii]|uniref:hypothetical protein n=1 Tax=Shewanella waksmanii TaxID=213783 RepID=UPI00048D13FE|nr:hypothetical protein [Shewanella waksmanii]
MKGIKRYSITMLATLLAAVTAPAYGDQAGNLRVSVGGFYSTSDSGMEVTSPLTDKEFDLDFETDLELVEREFLPFIELAYWVNDDHVVYADWKQLHRDAENTSITVPYEFQHPDTGDTYTVQAGAKITTTFNVDIARVGYGYRFYKDDNWDLIATLGLHVMWLELGFSGDLGLCIDESCEIINVDPDQVVFTEMTAPLPDVGLLAAYSFADNWRITAHGQYFYLKVDDISGSLIDFSGGIEYQFTPQFYTDLSYKYYKVDVDVEGDFTDTNIYYGFHGPMLTFSYLF